MWCVEGGYFQKAKDCTNDLESCLMMLLLMMMLFVKDARGEKSTNKLDGILLSCHCYLKLSLII